MEKGQYAIGLARSSEGKAKPFLFKVTGQHKGIVSGFLTRDSHIPGLKSSVEVPIKDVIINLGAEPFPGKVHGCDLNNLYTGKKLHENFGQIHWFYKPEPTVGQNLFAALDKVYKVLKQNRLEFIVQPDNCMWEVLPFHGEKYAGMYCRSKKPESSPHRLQIRPEIMPSSDYPYVITHELMHHLHKEFATGSKLQAAWIQLYGTTIKVSSIRKDQSTEMLEALLAQEDPPSAYKSNLSEEDTQVYKLILKSIQQNHQISVKELDLLFEADYRDDIRSVWPTRGIAKKDLAPVVSEYATTKWYELVAEACSYRLTGQKLPKEVEALVDKTFSYARSNHEKRSN
jgi:hypothetical protein